MRARVEKLYVLGWNKSHYGPVYGGGAETGAKDIQAVEVTGRGGCVSDLDGDLGGGRDIRGGIIGTGWRQIRIKLVGG